MQNTGLFAAHYSNHFFLFQNVFLSRYVATVHKIPTFRGAQLTIFSRLRAVVMPAFFNICFLTHLLLQAPYSMIQYQDVVRRARKKFTLLGQFYVPQRYLGLFLFIMNMFIFAFSLQDGFMPGFFGHRSYTAVFRRTMFLTHPFFYRYFYRIRRSRWRFRVATTFFFSVSVRKRTSGLIFSDLIRFFNVPISRRAPLYSFDWIRYILYSHKGWRTP